MILGKRNLMAMSVAKPSFANPLAKHTFGHANRETLETLPN
jgi:hypothetical protein